MRGSVISSLACEFHVSPAGRCTSITGPWESLSCIPKEDVYRDWRCAVWKEDRGWLVAKLTAAAARQENWSARYRLIGPDGGPIEVKGVLEWQSFGGYAGRVGVPQSLEDYMAEVDQIVWQQKLLKRSGELATITEHPYTKAESSAAPARPRVIGLNFAGGEVMTSEFPVYLVPADQVTTIRTFKNQADAMKWVATFTKSEARNPTGTAAIVGAAHQTRTKRVVKVVSVREIRPPTLP